MSFKLGIDTGGTYTDAVVFNDQRGVVATAKALTTRHDLAVGVRAAMALVLTELGEAQSTALELVAISTTLATNAIVEGEGARTCLILIGQPDNILDRANLGNALGDDHVERVAGGHQASGEPATDLDTDAINDTVDRYSGRVESFAVAGYFAVRNPAHEVKARELIAARSGLPVSLSHELSSNLDAPRRALTTLFNARLIPLLRELIQSVQDEMNKRAINAPLMVVQGDGSLVQADTALHRPVETILSGPAASVTGARYLAGIDDAMISDVGGTTTDIAVIRNGLPRIDNDGATVADFRTMVRAVRVHTVGLGGDSETGQGDDNAITLGPRRAIPLTLASGEYAGLIQDLKSQLVKAQQSDGGRVDGEFAVRIRHLDSMPTELSAIELETWEMLADGPCPLARLFVNPRRESALTRLRRRGLVTRIGFTPTDAAHALGLQNHLDREAANTAAKLWAIRFGFDDSDRFCRAVLRCFYQQSARALTDAAIMMEKSPPPSIDSWFVHRSFNPADDELLQASLTLNRPVVGIGAPAATFYPQIAELLHTTAVVPPDAQVCNAVGAVVSGVLRTVDILITSPQEGLYRVHSPQGISDHADHLTATETAVDIGNRLATAAAEAAGARDVGLEQQIHHEVAHAADGTQTYIEGRISIVATGQPATSEATPSNR